MLRLLLFILAIVILLAIILNIDIFTTTNQAKQLIQHSKSKSVQEAPSVQSTMITKTDTIVSQESNLSRELQKLLNQAQHLYRIGKQDEAIVIYEKVIKKSKDSNEIKILNFFARACLNQANVHYSYPKYDIESAIESLELILDKFEKKQNKELLLHYMDAKLNRARLISKEELLESYNDLIEKFQKDKEQRFEKEIEQLRYAKSFALMGVDDEEAIAVLDRLIAKYNDKNKSNLPDTVKYSILNNIELSIITSNDTDKYVDLANKYMSDLPDTKPLIDMLSIIKNSQDLEQDEAVQDWVEQHKNYAFADWDFSELKKWANNMEVPERKKRVLKYLNIFEQKKYSEIYKVEKTPPPKPKVSPEAQESVQVEEKWIYSSTVSSEAQKNLEVDEENSNNNDEEEAYLNDVLETQPEITYPNPYAPNEEADGVSYDYVEPQIYRD